MLGTGDQSSQLIVEVFRLPMSDDIDLIQLHGDCTSKIRRLMKCLCKRPLILAKDLCNTVVDSRGGRALVVGPGRWREARHAVCVHYVRYVWNIIDSKRSAICTIGLSMSEWRFASPRIAASSRILSVCRLLLQLISSFSKR